jgi:alkylhydroperoxidase family enzyme
MAAVATADTPVLLEQIQWDAPLYAEPPAAPEIEALARRTLGQVPSFLRWVAECDWLARACIAAMDLKLAYISVDTAALAGLVVSQDNSCRYCYGTHRVFLQLLGHDTARVRRLEQDLHTAELSPKDKAALDFVRQISRANPRPARPEREALLRAGFSPPAVAELAYAATTMCFLNRVATLLALPPDAVEKQAGSLMMRLLRPFIARSIRKKASAPPSVAPAADGPFPELVDALHGSPAASALRRIVELAWSSPGMPLRAKELVVAIVGRALNCPLAPARTRERLGALGLSGEDLEPLLANLSSPKLDAFEARLVAFARETVRYRPEVIQPRVRDFSQGLTRAQLLESIGVSALANSVCRLSILLS